MHSIKIFSHKYSCGIAVVNNSSFVTHLAKFLLKSLVEDFCTYHNSPNLCRTLLCFIPHQIGKAVENELSAFFSDNNEMQLEGFVNFRLAHIRQKFFNEIFKTTSNPR